MIHKFIVIKVAIYIIECPVCEERSQALAGGNHIEAAFFNSALILKINK